MFLWDELRGFPRPILIYGMGNGADKILALCREYGIAITGIFSSDSHAREGMFQGCPVLSRTKALEQYPDAMILLGFGTERPDEEGRFAGEVTNPFSALKAMINSDEEV